MGNHNAMNKRRAKKMINELVREASRDNVRRQFWMDKVQGYTKQIFGKFTDNIALPMFETYYNSNDLRFKRPVKDITDANADELTKILKEMFSVYLEFIDHEVFEKKNWFSNDTNGTVATNLGGFAIFIAGLVWVIAYGEGVRSVNIEKKELQIKIHQLESKLSATKHQPKNEIKQCK